MTITQYAGHPVQTDDEGFFDAPDAWTEDMAPEIARDAGIAELTDQHWRVIASVRAEYAAKGASPGVRSLSRLSQVPVKELYRLFPKGPAKTAARIAGVPKPHGCI